MNSLHLTTERLVSPGRGLLAADESVPTMSKRLESAGVRPSEESRRSYRELLLTTPGLSRWVFGVIFCEETIGQRLSDGRTFATACHDLDILLGVKVDLGTRPLALVPGATVTVGLDTLRERLATFKGQGARFAKWRAVLGVGGGGGSDAAVHANAAALARFAALCQEIDLVPVVEPEVLMSGEHFIDACAEQVARTLSAVFRECAIARVDLSGIVLKTSMVLPGDASGQEVTPDEVARATLDVLRTCVPEQVPCLAFLSGGQSHDRAVANLGALNSRGAQPWRLTFSFGRALVDDALAAWGGQSLRWASAQIALAGNCRRAAQASRPGSGSTRLGARTARPA